MNVLNCFFIYIFLIFFSIKSSEPKSPIFKIIFQQNNVVEIGILQSKESKQANFKNLNQKEAEDLIQQTCVQGARILQTVKKWPINPYSFIIHNEQVEYCENNEQNANLTYVRLFQFKTNNIK